MANEVNNYVTIKSSNPKVLEDIKKLFKTKGDDSQEIWTTDFVNFIEGTNKDENEITHDYAVDNLGAKWVRAEITNSDDDYIEFTAISAWDPINLMCDKLCTKLMETDEKVVVENIFEEEGYQNVGGSYYSKEYSDEEYVDMDDWDLDRLFEDDEYKEELDNEIKGIMERHRENHLDEINGQ